jgi:branched-chain amino acid transport system ATP-binding protein
MSALLEVDSVSTGYGDIRALWDITLEVQPGRVTVVLGRNGSGKTTMLSAVAGLLPCWNGAVRFEGRDISRVRAHKRVNLGISLVQEGKRVFRKRTVEENLRLAAYTTLPRREVKDAIDQQFERFPILRDRRKLTAAILSGGEQQMLAIAQALIAKPKLLMLDEPTAGLAPSMVNRVFDIVAALKAEGFAILLVEQVVHVALNVADDVYILDLGRVRYKTTKDKAIDVKAIEDVYFGAQRLHA